MTPEELREWYINDIESKQIVIDDLQAQLSAKEQECEELKRINSEYKQLLADRGKRVADLSKTIEIAYDWLKDPGVPIQAVITILRKSKEKLLSQ